MSLPVLTFVLALVLSFAILMAATRPAQPNRIVQKRLTTIQHPERAGIKSVELEKAGARNYAARFGDLLRHYQFSKRLQTLLVHADSTMSVGAVVLASAGLALGCGVLGSIFLHTLPLAVVAALPGAALPHGWLRLLRGRRLKAFDADLPEAIDLMARALRAGHSMATLMELVGDQSHEPLAGEFMQVFQQQKFGLRFRDALIQMGDRIPSTDLHFLITAMLVQKETGGDLTEILDRTAYVIRDRMRIEGEVRTHTAQGRLTGWILGSLPVILLVLMNLVSPGYSTLLFHDPTGQKLLYAGAIFIAIGGLVIRKIVDIKV